MASEHNPEKEFYCLQCRCWHCYAEGFWPGVESFTAYQETQQQLAQARALLERWIARYGGNDWPSPTHDLAEDTRAFLAEPKT